MCSCVILSQTSRELKVAGAIGPCVSLNVKGPCVSENVRKTSSPFPPLSQIWPLRWVEAGWPFVCHLLACVCAEGWRVVSSLSFHPSIWMVREEKAETRRGSVSCSGSELTQRSQAQVPLTCYSCLGGRAREPLGIPSHGVQPFWNKLMCLLPLEGLPLSHFSETIRVGWAVGDTVRADVGVPRVRGSTVQPLPDGEVALLVACFLFSHFSYQGCTSGPVRPVQAGSGQGDDVYVLPHRHLQLEGGREGWMWTRGGWSGQGTSRIQDSASLLGNKGSDGTCCIALLGGFSEQPRGSTGDARTRFHPSHQSSVLSSDCFTSDYLEQVWSCQRQDNLWEFSCNPLGEVDCCPKRLWWVPHHPQVLWDLYSCFSLGPWEASLFLNIPHRLRICLRRCCWLVHADELLWGPAGISHDTCWWGGRRQRRGKYSFQTHWEVWEECNESSFPT